jgi:Uma2 family endonuclease
MIAGQASVPLTATDEPQPDITLFRPGTERKPKSSWTHADLLGLFELSDSTLRRDTGPKRKAYARGGVAEYLIVDLRGARLLRHRKPDGADYRTVDELDAGDRFALEALPDIPLDVSALLRSARPPTASCGESGVLTRVNTLGAASCMLGWGVE